MNAQEKKPGMEPGGQDEQHFYFQVDIDRALIDETTMNHLRIMRAAWQHPTIEDAAGYCITCAGYTETGEMLAKVLYDFAWMESRTARDMLRGWGPKYSRAPKIAGQVMTVPVMLDRDQINAETMANLRTICEARGFETPEIAATYCCSGTGYEYAERTFASMLSYVSASDVIAAKDYLDKLDRLVSKKA